MFETEPSGGGPPSDRSIENARPIHVALDLRLIDNSGIGSYLRGLLGGFAELGAPIVWTFIGPQAEIPAGLDVREWIDFRAPIYSRQEFLGYPRLPPEVDLFHYPHYNLPLASARRRVVTVYDLFHLEYGSFAKRLYQRFFLARLAWTKVPVISISDKTSEDIQHGSRIRAARVRTIALGPGSAAPPSPPPSPPEAAQLRDGTSLDPPWFLCVGIDQEHKNMDFLIGAMALWYRRRTDAPPLVWTGVAPDRLEERIANIPAYARQKISIEPYRTEAELERLYGGAMALIFPSLDEGFGFPPLEAMARGVPVLCSRRRPMTDLLGQAPLWFDPEESSSLWRALDRLLDERGLHHEIAERGTERVSRFSWLRTARETYRYYLEIVGGSG